MQSNGGGNNDVDFGNDLALGVTTLSFTKVSVKNR